MSTTQKSVKTEVRVDTTLVKGIRILEALVSSNSPMGISTLSSNLGLGKSNIHRLLTTMTELGFVRQEADTKRYLATLKSWELGSFVVERDNVRRIARSAMRELLAKTGESTFLSMLSGTDILYLEKFEGLGAGAARSASRSGLRVPALMSPSGKLLIALQPNFEALTDRAIEDLPNEIEVSRIALIDELTAIRDQRYSTSVGSWTRGINAITVPVGAKGRPPVAALGIALLPDRWTQSYIAECLALLIRAAEQIEGAIDAPPEDG